MPHHFTKISWEPVNSLPRLRKQVHYCSQKYRLAFFENGLALIDLVVAGAFLLVGGALTLSLISSSNNGIVRMNQHAKAQLGIAARMEEIREEAFSLYCTSGCSENELDNTLQYDEDAISDVCTNKTFGQKLLERLQENDPDLSADFNIQIYDAAAPSINIASTASHNQNALTVALTSNASASSATTTFVPNALGWCK